MSNPTYPLAAGRGTVTGTVAEAHGRSVAGATVTLAQTGALIDQGYDYMFWSQADGSGRFTIPRFVQARNSRARVRDGRHPRGRHDRRLRRRDRRDGDGRPQAHNDLGTLTWSPPCYHANLLWSIGSLGPEAREPRFRFDPNKTSGGDNIGSMTGRTYGPSAADGVWTIPGRRAPRTRSERARPRPTGTSRRASTGRGPSTSPWRPCSAGGACSDDRPGRFWLTIRT